MAGINNYEKLFFNNNIDGAKGLGGL